MSYGKRGNDKSTKASNVGIIGLGSVGIALRDVLGHCYPCTGYDVKGNWSTWDDVLRTSVAFVCVQTPLGTDGRLDCSHVEAVLNRLSKDHYPNPVAIRSTIRVGFMDRAQKMFQGLRLVYFPEFLRERSSFLWSANPDRLLVSGEKQDVDIVLSYFDWVEETVTIRTDYRSAEIGKLAHNAFIAAKVSFTNEIERVSLELGADPRTVMDVVAADRRVKSREHLRPFMGPYGGKCVPKDTDELISAAGDSAILLKAAREVNENTKHNLLHPPIYAGQVSSSNC